MVDTNSITITRERVLELLSEEKETFSLYLQLCNHYQIDMDPIAAAASKATTSILKKLLAGMPISASIVTLKTKISPQS